MAAETSLKTREGIAACIEYPVKTQRGIKNELLEITLLNLIVSFD